MVNQIRDNVVEYSFNDPDGDDGLELVGVDETGGDGIRLQATVHDERNLRHGLLDLK